MKYKTTRNSIGQVFNAQYPCLASNLGLKKICVHINSNKLNPRALIYDFNEVSGKDEDENEDEIFMGFVNYNSFSDCGLDERHISIDITSRFAYLTRKPKGSVTDKKEQVYLNLLIVDAYNPIPQVVHFKSIKIFDFATKDEFEDVIKENLIFKVGDEFHLMT